MCSRPWTRKPRERPCGLLYNTGRCTAAGCLFSHDRRDISSWRDSQGRMPCAYGPLCDLAAVKQCIYSHPASPLSPKYRNRNSKFFTHRLSNPERQQRMTDGLVLVQSCDELSPKAAHGRPTHYTGMGRLTIRNERVLASYNKLGDNRIAVPGFPQQFVPPAQSINVKRDTDEHKDGGDDHSTTGTRRTYPTYTHSLEPLARAVQYMAPSCDRMLAATDIVANVGSLYRLSHYLSGDAVASHRFDLEWRTNGTGRGTLLMQQWNEDPNHTFSYGCGKNFASMTCHYPDDVPGFLTDSFTHHRVISYGFGQLQCVVHCEADGFYEPGVGVHARMPDAGLPTPPSSPRHAFAKPIAVRRQSLSVPSPPVSPPAYAPSAMGSRFAILDMGDDDDASDDDDAVTHHHSDTMEVTHHPGTRTIEAHQFVEIKTFSKMRNNRLAIPPEPQLYFGRTKKFYRAGHKSGCFSASGDDADEHVQDMTDKLQQWEDDQQALLARVHAVLLHVRTLAARMAAAGHTQLCLICADPADTTTAPMQVYIRPPAQPFLPADL